MLKRHQSNFLPPIKLAESWNRSAAADFGSDIEAVPGTEAVPGIAVVLGTAVEPDTALDSTGSVGWRAVEAAAVAEPSTVHLPESVGVFARGVTPPVPTDSGSAETAVRLGSLGRTAVAVVPGKAWTRMMSPFGWLEFAYAE